MMAYKKVQERKKEGSKGLGGERDQIKEEEGKVFHKWHVFGMTNGLWDREWIVGSETWKVCQ